MYVMGEFDFFNRLKDTIDLPYMNCNISDNVRP